MICGGIVAAATVASPGRTAARPVTMPQLRVQRLAWADLRLQLPAATLFIDPLIDPAVWAAALPDELIAVDEVVGESIVLITHRHSDHADAIAIAAALKSGGTLVYAAGTPPFGELPANVRQRLCPLWELQIFGDFTATPVPAGFMGRIGRRTQNIPWRRHDDAWWLVAGGWWLVAGRPAVRFF